MWEKLTAPPLWGNASVNGRPKPCAKQIRPVRKPLVRRSLRFERRSRKISKPPKSSVGRLSEREKRLDSSIDNARRSIPRLWLKRWRAGLFLIEKVSSSPKQPLTRRKCFRGSPWPFGIGKRRETEDGSQASSFRRLH